MPSRQAAFELVDEPDRPANAGPFVFLLDASSQIEHDLLLAWIERSGEAPNDSAFRIPGSRQRHRTRPDRGLEARAHEADDPLFVPLRVVWLAPERRGKRRVGLRDVFMVGDPRDPGSFRQRWILSNAPDRCRIVLGASARKTDLIESWRNPGGRGPADGTTLEEFVALRAWLALERAERALRGSRYKVPKFLSEVLFSSRGFQQGIARLATEEGRPQNRMRRRARRYLDEIAATHSPYVIDIVTGITGWLISLAYRGLNYSAEDLRDLYEYANEHSVVFLPSHKSNFDHLVLQFVLYENEFPPNHTAGGINLNFFPVGMLLRRSGIFFIRREFKDNLPYKFVLRQYLDYLLEKRFPLEWYLEGGRSRTGKLREPRLGLLSYVADAYSRGLVEDVALIPVSIAYDQISDLGAYTAEQRGGSKERESAAWALRFIRNLRNRYGRIHIRFGDPISVRERVPAGIDLETPEGRNVVPKLAFEVSTGINAVTPITPISLVTLALLSQHGLGLSVDQILTVLEPFIGYVKERELPTTEALALDTPDRVLIALRELGRNGVVARVEGFTDILYAIGHEQHLAAAYYRNTIIHFFLTSAIVEVALAGMVRAETSGAAELLDRAEALRDLLKFEFFFAQRHEFRNEVLAELDLVCPDGRDLIESGRLPEVLARFSPMKSPAVLRPFVEAYRVVADVLSFAGDEPLEPKEIEARALRLGRQYELQGIISTAEAVSTALFSHCIQLAENRGLLGGTDGVAKKREEFARDIRATIADLDRIDSLVTRIAY